MLDGSNSLDDIKMRLYNKYNDSIYNLEEAIGNIISGFSEKELLKTNHPKSQIDEHINQQTSAKSKSTRVEIIEFYFKNYFIRKVDLELTYRCNFKCRHCYNIADYKNELSTAEWKNVMDQLADMGCLDLAFTGGEVFVRKDFLELLEYACKKEFSIRIKTNGSLITKEIAEILGSCKPYLLDVEISLYGTTSNTFDWFVQRSNAFDKICNAMRYLRENKITVYGKYLIMKQNFSELTSLRSFIKDHDIQVKISSGSMIPRVDGDKSTLDYMISTDEQRLLIEQYSKQSISLPSKVQCDPAKTRCSISPNGNVCSCEWLSDIPFGNIRKETLSEIWLNSPEIIKFRDANSADPEECKDCSFSEYCGRCPARAYLETGNLAGKSPISCNIAQMCSELVESN